MRLNWLGRAAMNNAARRLAQRYVASWFERLGGRVDGGQVLEVGCGGGAGIAIILERFKAARVEAVDLDPKMIDVARRRVSQRHLDRTRLSLGDVTCLTMADATFDAVFDFGAIHLEPNWQKAVSEVRRVLKPNGKFYFELVTSRFLRLSYPLVTEAFQRVEPPRVRMFLDALENEGIVVGGSFVQPRVAALSGLVGDLVGVGQLRSNGDAKGRVHLGRVDAID
jgi:ubiquinone/menaquinone biosynthesis C-methylase UbiE